MQNLFNMFLIIGTLSFIINMIIKTIHWFKEKWKNNDIFDIFIKSLFNKISIMCFIISIIIYSLFSLNPYLENEKDHYLIESYNMNISLE